MVHAKITCWKNSTVPFPQLSVGPVIVSAIKRVEMVKVERWGGGSVTWQSREWVQGHCRTFNYRESKIRGNCNERHSTK